MEKKVHPELREIFSLLPEINIGCETLGIVRKAAVGMLAQFNASRQNADAVSTSERMIPGPDGSPLVRVKIYKPKAGNQILPGVLYIHSGGYLFGSPEMEDPVCYSILSENNCVIASVDYRLAPENRFPAAVEDCYAALKWFSDNSEELGVDPSRIAVVGGSTGGGLTAAVSLLARDRKGPSIAFQMPLCPMIDNSCTTPSSNEITDPRVWNNKLNRQSWEMYLGADYAEEASPYAAPARATDLSGLPPTYTCVGDLDPFCDETIEYVLKLRQAGVPTEFHLFPGCFHGFHLIFSTAQVSQRYINDYERALRDAFKK